MRLGLGLGWAGVGMGWGWGGVGVGGWVGGVVEQGGVEHGGDWD